MKLADYNKKRNFKKTPEPKGKVSHKYKHLFIIQKHAASHLHYDFRLELNGVLLSWAVPKGPSLDPSVKRLAMHVEDHPVEYGYFEGVIPKGEYGGGTVMLWDKGQWIPEDEDPVEAYRKGHLHFQLKAKKLHGRWNLFRLKKDDDKSWFLVKGKDEYSQPLKKYDVTQEEPNSVLTNNSLDEIAENYKNMWTRDEGLKKASKKKLQKKVKKFQQPRINLKLPISHFHKILSPQLATLVDKAPDGDEWLHEIKLDGYRILTFKERHNVRLMSRNNKEWTSDFYTIAKEIKNLFNQNIILDGELVLLDKNGVSNFQLLQNAVGEGTKQDFIYYIFDILYYDKHDLRSLSLLERKEILKKLIPNNCHSIRYSDHIIGNGSEIWKNACQMGLEGIISKNIHSKYQEKRSKDWLKVKCVQRQEFVIGGYSPPQGAREHFGSLYLGYYDENGQLKFCGNVGTGFNRASLEDIHAKLLKIKTNKNPFTTKPPGVTSAIWVKPQLIAEVEFTEWTGEGSLRHPSFKGLRSDKSPKSITREVKTKMKNIEASRKTKNKSDKVKPSYRLTSPDKILYPEDKITKADLANYYETIQKWILPYLVNRPLTLVRCPENYKKCFYQKHINKSTPKELEGVMIKEKEKKEEYIYIKDSIGLMAIVQMGALEIHPWGSRIEKLEYPDMITFDLDPDQNLPWKTVVKAANRIKDHLKEYKLKSFVKTTGGKGLHVVVPIQPKNNWKDVKNFSHVFVQFLVKKYPDEYVSEMSKLKRKGKIFIDYLRNQRGATAISAYSTRARPGAPVSVPLDWDELNQKREAVTFTIETLPNRLEKLKQDPWKDFFKTKQSLRLNKLISD